MAEEIIVIYFVLLLSIVYVIRQFTDAIEQHIDGLYDTSKRLLQCNKNIEESEEQT